MCFLDHNFAQHWTYKYPEFKAGKPNANGLGRKLPGGAWNYYGGNLPSFCKSGKVWGTDVDDNYVPLNYKNNHWVAMWISIPKRHIVVWDNIVGHIKDRELAVLVEPFVNMIPYLLAEYAASDVVRAEYSLESFTYERLKDLPQARSGDCGVYVLKYIECHALGMPFNKKDFAKSKGKAIRDKMAVDIFEEFPDVHLCENRDGDENYGAYGDDR
ncbi:hypothetical protein Bca4012_020120 [Brassica carinata]